MNFLWKDTTVFSHLALLLCTPVLCSAAILNTELSPKKHKMPQTLMVTLKRPTHKGHAFITWGLEQEVNVALWLDLPHLGACTSGNSTFLLSTHLPMSANDLKGVMSIDFRLTNEYQTASQFANTELTDNETHCISVDLKRCISLKICIGSHFIQRQEDSD